MLTEAQKGRIARAAPGILVAAVATFLVFLAAHVHAGVAEFMRAVMP